MIDNSRVTDPAEYSENLYRKMMEINPGVAGLELYEFCYALENLTPKFGWNSIEPAGMQDIDRVIQTRKFYENIQLKPKRGDRIVLDDAIVHLTQMLFVGLLGEIYPVQWVRERFYFDLRGFIFFVRSQYYTPNTFHHFGGHPFARFDITQSYMEGAHEIGYKEFKEANREIDAAFLDVIQKLISNRNAPFLMTISGPTGAGKTEITDRLRAIFEVQGKKLAAIGMDHFFKDREYRDRNTLGREVIHFQLFKLAMPRILRGEKIIIPRYDFYNATSSHDLEGNLRPGATPQEIESADIILLEGNFPFHLPELVDLVGIKIVYLTDDPIRLKRKWKRDIDFRKKYDANFFCNRYFRTQFLRAEDVYRPLMEVCDLIVDTTAASLWITPQIVKELNLNSAIWD